MSQSAAAVGGKMLVTVFFLIATLTFYSLYTYTNGPENCFLPAAMMVPKRLKNILTMLTAWFV
jgi:hypothetical protein